MGLFACFAGPPADTGSSSEQQSALADYKRQLEQALQDKARAQVELAAALQGAARSTEQYEKDKHELLSKLEKSQPEGEAVATGKTRDKVSNSDSPGIDVGQQQAVQARELSDSISPNITELVRLRAALAESEERAASSVVLASELEELKLKLQELQAGKEALSASEVSYNKEAEELKAKLQATECELSEITKEKTTLRAAALEANDKARTVDLLSGELEATREQLHILQAQLAETDKDRQQLVDDLALSRQTVASFESQLASITQQFQEAAGACINGQTQVHVLSATVASLPNVCTSMQLIASDGLSTLESSAAALVQAYHASQEFTVQVQRERSYFESQLRQLRTDVQAARDDLRETLSSFAELNSVFAEQKEQYEDLLMDNKQMRMELGQAKNMNESTNESTMALLEDYQKLKEKMRALTSEMRVKDEMMELLQHQLTDIADIDIDNVLGVDLEQVLDSASRMIANDSIPRMVAMHNA